MGKGSSGGQTTTETIDKEYNAGMLAISQEQQGWAAEMFNMFKFGVPYDPSERGAMVNGQWVSEKDLTSGKGAAGTTGFVGTLPSAWGGLKIPGVTPSGAKITTRGEAEGYEPGAQTSEMEYLQNLVEANQGLLGLQTDVSAKELTLAGEQAEAGRKLLPYTTEYGIKSTEASTGLIPYQTEATKQKSLLAGETAEAARAIVPGYYENMDIDERKWMDEAQAGVQHGFKLANEAARRDIASYGLDPGAGRYTSVNRERTLAEATGIAGARTAAERQAEEEEFRRKTEGLQIGGNA